MKIGFLPWCRAFFLPISVEKCRRRGLLPGERRPGSRFRVRGIGRSSIGNVKEPRGAGDIRGGNRTRRLLAVLSRQSPGSTGPWWLQLHACTHGTPFSPISPTILGSRGHDGLGVRGWRYIRSIRGARGRSDGYITSGGPRIRSRGHISTEEIGRRLIIVFRGGSSGSSCRGR